MGDEAGGGREATGWPWSANECVAIQATVCLPSPTFRFTGQQLLLPYGGGHHDYSDFISQALRELQVSHAVDKKHH